MRGAKEAAARLAAFGWCTAQPFGEEDGLVLAWSEDASGVLAAMGDPGPGGILYLAGLYLFLDLLGQYVEPSFASRLVQLELGKVWATRLLCQAARGRYRPSWWDLDSAWREAIRAGEVRMPLMYADEVEEGQWGIIQRLAEFGWLDYKTCSANGSTQRAFRWRKELVPLLNLILLPSALTRPESDADWEAQGVQRLSLLLHLRAMFAPIELQAEIAASAADSDRWCKALAVRVARGCYPLWWNRSAAWHKAVRDQLIAGRAYKELLGGAE